MKKLDFGVTRNNEKASKYILKNKHGMEVALSDFGATILSICLEDKNGAYRDVLLGYDTLEEYYDNSCGFGAYIGRNSNRIGDAKVIIGGVEYSLEANNHNNNLHSGNNRSHYQFYQTVTGMENGLEYVEFQRVSPHLEQGFPGNLDQKIRYTLTEENELSIRYEMISDMDTVINPTNHSYFNLNGHDSGDILKHKLEVYSDAFLLTDSQLLPTGKIASVEDTPMDFRMKKEIGVDIHVMYEPIQLAGGYDHNYIFENNGLLKKMARVEADESGLYMETYSDLCGMQVYSGNFLNGRNGKANTVYEKHAGICFEAQFYPNSCKEPTFPSCICEANKEFFSTTIYKFGQI